MWQILKAQVDPAMTRILSAYELNAEDSDDDVIT